MDIRTGPTLMTATTLALVISACVLASNAMATEAQSPSKHRLQKTSAGLCPHIKAVSGYGRGYDGYDAGRSQYGAAALAYPATGVSQERRPWGYLNGFPVYLYPLNATRMIGPDSDYEQFHQHEEEVSSPDGEGNLLTSGNHCSTPIITCTLNDPGFSGGGCSCRIEGGRSRGKVTE